MVSAELVARSCQQKCCEVIYAEVAGRKLPQVCAELFQGPWMESLQYILINEGEKSSLWKSALALTATILESFSINPANI